MQTCDLSRFLSLTSNLITQPVLIIDKSESNVQATFVTSLSDHHKLISVLMELGISRGPSRAIFRGLISFRQL